MLDVGFGAAVFVYSLIAPQVLIFGFDPWMRDEWAAMQWRAALGGLLWLISSICLAAGIIIIVEEWNSLQSRLPTAFSLLGVGVTIPWYWVLRIVVEDAPAVGRNGIQHVIGTNTVRYGMAGAVAGFAGGLLVKGLWRLPLVIATYARTTRRRLIAGAVISAVLLGLGYVAGRAMHRPAPLLADYEERTLLALRRSSASVAQIVTCRGLVDSTGELRSADLRGNWESLWPALNEQDVDLPQDGVSAVMVFVPGYNNGLAEQIESGTSLSNEWRSAIRRLASHDVAFAFVTFCWRGDFGAEQFGTAVAAANASAPSLRSYLLSVQEYCHTSRADGGRVPLIVVAHSLGSRVLLEALLMGGDVSLWIDGVLFVQPAVAVEDIALITIRDSEGREHHPFIPVDDVRYWDVFSSVGDAASTVSVADDVLGQWFSLYMDPNGANWFAGNRALGRYVDPALARWDSALKLAFPPKLRLLDVSPGQESVAMDDHSEIFRDQELVDWLWLSVVRHWQ